MGRGYWLFKLKLMENDMNIYLKRTLVYETASVVIM